MFEKKNCVINCDVCDTRNMQPDVFDGFEQVVINADIVVVNEVMSWFREWDWRRIFFWW